MNLSEYKAHSDRRRRKNHEPVRIQGSFGQEMEEKARCCPNTRLIRTGEGGKTMNQSEYKAHLDRRRSKNHEVVRIQGSFGQEREEKPRTCQNTRLILTGEGGKTTMLSEYKAHSDRRRRKNHEAVRIQSSFGQEKEEKSPLQSEYKAHSDRRRRKKPSSVRIQSSFGQKREETVRK
ncbi:hypothetical protein [Bacillus litorisediminis]|uniref:hypothetical protein n=1 Tax=Bacillus litorisediminis TaxID=2922713 RepID=UPI001FAFCCE9|nr:hypothetical protein [Bacillus litorisediminis]